MILEKCFIDSRTEVQTMRKEKAKLEASNVEQNKRIASLEAELGQMKKEYEIEMMKLSLSSTDVAVNLSSAQVKIEIGRAHV